MLDITVSYGRLRLQLFPRLLSKRSKQEHVAGLQKVIIHQMHNWLPKQERWQDSPALRLRPRGRELSGNAKDGGMEGGRNTHRKMEQSPYAYMFLFLPTLMAKLLKASAAHHVFQWT